MRAGLSLSLEDIMDSLIIQDGFAPYYAGRDTGNRDTGSRDTGTRTATVKKTAVRATTERLPRLTVKSAIFLEKAKAGEH